MEQNKELRNEPTLIWSVNLQRKKNAQWEKVCSINVGRKTAQVHEKETRKHSHII